ncbi:MAG: HAD family phosphatase [Deltaproteobacteria bacterium]|nr:MAG: HAD family phosphatase [Deltaproteobacteria bacterium]
MWIKSERDKKTVITVFPQTKGFIFDCDGTLADTMPLHMEAWCETFADYGEDCPYEFVFKLRGTPVEQIVELFNQKFGRKINAKNFAQDKNRRAHEKLKQAKPIDPVIRIVKKYRGKLPMAVASGGTRQNVILTLEVIGLSNHFDAVITSDENLKPKPAPDIFLEIARRLKVDPRFCQVFEDGDVGLQAARKAGMVATDVRPYILEPGLSGSRFRGSRLNNPER